MREARAAPSDENPALEELFQMLGKEGYRFFGRCRRTVDCAEPRGWRKAPKIREIRREDYEEAICKMLFLVPSRCHDYFAAASTS